MVFGFNLIIASVLRGFQILFALVIFGLSIMLVNDHNLHGGQPGWPRVPIILPLAITIGALSLSAAVFSLVISWTNYLREYIEMLVDVVVVLANIVGGVVRLESTCRLWCRWELILRADPSYQTQGQEL
jgi:hypothetical protein